MQKHALKIYTLSVELQSVSWVRMLFTSTFWVSETGVLQA